MALSEEILEHLEKLPEPFQAEVLDFVEYLESKISRGNRKDSEDKDWSKFSLSLAMQGVEDDCSLYSIEDIKEKLI